MFESIKNLMLKFGYEPEMYKCMSVFKFCPRGLMNWQCRECDYSYKKPYFKFITDLELKLKELFP